MPPVIFWAAAVVCVGLSKPASSSLLYPAINVWPMPLEVHLCSGTECAGPHSVAISAPQLSIAPTCASSIRALLNETLHLATTFKASPRTFDEAPYAAADSFCTSRCHADGDCPGGGDRWCYVPWERRWSSSRPCSPIANYSTGCGCCVQGSRQLPAISSLSIDCGESSVSAQEGSYTLSVTPDAVKIAASTSQGAAYALSTLAQLVRHEPEMQSGVIDFVPLFIADEPKFSWRGHMLDTSRHFIPVDQILTLLDGMHAAKLNIFHWHVVDAPSFPMASQKFPELTQGAWSARAVYSVADQQAVVQRAEERFIQVVMEIDTPAHTLAVAKSHPEMMSDCWEWMATARFKVDVDSTDTMALDPTNPSARHMVAELLPEAAALQGAHSQFLHIGGDEVKFGCWNADPAIRAHVISTYGSNSTEAFARLQAEWTANVSAAAAVSAGKRPVLWQPTTQGPGDPAWDGVLPKDSVYMIWLNAQSEKSYAVNGSDVVYTTPFYVAGMGGGGWTSVYNADIVPTGISPDQQKHVLGAEVCMWGENMDAANVGVRAFQIGAAAAESFWRDHPKTEGPGIASGLGTSDRYNRFLCHLKRYGIDAAPVMPSLCEVHGPPA